MKNKLYVMTIGLMMLGVMSVFAQPPGKGPQTRMFKSLKTVEDFEAAKAKDGVGFVCMQCHSVTELVLEDDESKMALCKEGAKVPCPVCKKRYTSVHHGQPGGKGHTHRKVTYVNDKGEECAFITQLKAGEEQE